ncbi:hypothetical protein [Histidinibacterium lentulum]|uniref:hypothetical protein n=1 Tax=Histidinibacterium lentulum TaxID=2480588 RepID=UPI000F4BA97E|nr:hypothetical protein [Histidinibacterium lentulum]
MSNARTAVLDEMTEFAIEELLSGRPERPAALVRRMAERWPEEPALGLVFAVTSAVAGIEDSFGGAAPQEPVISLGYRIAALAAADVHAIQAMGHVPALAEDLLHFWRRSDPAYFGPRGR